MLDSPPPPYDWTFRRVVWATLVVASVALGFWLLYRFRQAVFVLFVGILMGTVIRPVVAWLHRRGLPRIAGGILTYVLLLGLLAGFLLLLFPVIVQQGTMIAVAVPGYYQSLRERMMTYSHPLMVRLSEFLPETLPSLGLVRQTGAEMIASAEQALGHVNSAAKIGFLALVILILTFAWTLDGPHIIGSLLTLLPRARRKGTSELIAAMETKVGAYIAGQSVLCLIVGALALAAYLLIGLPNALVLALVAGILEAVPMVGPLLGAIPAALVGLSVAPAKLVWVIVATIAIQQLEGSLLVPRVMRKAVGVNPFVSLLALFAFGSLFGVAGALMAIPLAAIIQLLLNRFVFEREAAETESTAGRGYAARLRYEAQDLIRDLRRQARLKKGGSDLRVEQTEQIMDEIEALATEVD
ncbi:MAG: AI-2E family transporter, partial [Anaerolineae bacterium]|nr:AI-2E family transporter [Anaerolineae bacterium]